MWQSDRVNRSNRYGRDGSVLRRSMLLEVNRADSGVCALTCWRTQRETGFLAPTRDAQVIACERKKEAPVEGALVKETESVGLCSSLESMMNSLICPSIVSCISFPDSGRAIG
jgi:hypothetical protein